MFTTKKLAVDKLISQMRNVGYTNNQCILTLQNRFELTEDKARQVLKQHR